MQKIRYQWLRSVPPYRFVRTGYTIYCMREHGLIPWLTEAAQTHWLIKQPVRKGLIVSYIYATSRRGLRSNARPLYQETRSITNAKIKP